MLKDAYPFRFVMNEVEKYANGKNISLKLCSFKSTKSNLAYIVRIELYAHNVYTVKFYPKCFSNSPNRYRLVTNTFEPRRIINTCINIMLSIYNDDDMASFGFIGANGLDEESTYCTKRYRVYSTLMATYFSEEVFEHFMLVSKSAYLLIRKSELAVHPDLLHDLNAGFKRLYDYFD